MEELKSYARFADLVGTTEQTVRNWVRRGMPREEDGIPVLEALKWMAAPWWVFFYG